MSMTESVAKSSSPGGGLRRELGLGSAAGAVAGEAIAVGIFLTPAGIDGVFLTAVTQLHPRFATPVRAIGIMGLMPRC